MMGADPLDLAVFDSDLQTLSPDHHQHQDSSSDVRSRQADISTGSAGAVVFIGDLTRFCDEESVIKFFEENLSEECRGVPGKIVERVLIKRAKAGVSMGYGFVCMRNAHTAERAIALLDGKMFNGRRIRVRRGVRKDGGEFVFPLSSDLRDHADEISPVTNSSAFEPIVRDQSDVAKRATEVVGLNSGHSNLVNNNSLYIRFVSVEKGKNRVTESLLFRVFNQFGEVLDVTIRSSYFDRVTGAQSGFAFVHFLDTPEGIKQSLRVLQCFPTFQAETVTFACEPSKNFRKLVGADGVPQSLLNATAASAPALATPSPADANSPSETPTPRPESSPNLSLSTTAPIVEGNSQPPLQNPTLPDYNFYLNYQQQQHLVTAPIPMPLPLPLHPHYPPPANLPSASHYPLVYTAPYAPQVHQPNLLSHVPYRYDPVQPSAVNVNFNLLGGPVVDVNGMGYIPAHEFQLDAIHRSGPRSRQANYPRHHHHHNHHRQQQQPPPQHPYPRTNQPQPQPHPQPQSQQPQAPNPSDTVNKNT